MFFPVGLGTWPKLFPFAIFSIALVCVMWSIPYFKASKAYDSYAVSQSKSLSTLKLKVIQETCLITQKSEACKTLDELIKKQQAKTDKIVKEKPAPETIVLPDEAATPKAVATEKKKPSTKQVLEEISDTLKNANLVLEFAGKFKENPKTWPAEAAQAKSYPDFMAAYTTYQTGMHKVEKDRGFLTRDNINFARLVRASFTHGGWAHLLGNLLFLVIFGLAVEQRMGWGPTLAVFLIGSFTGLGFQLFYSTGAVLGASAGIMAIMGAFFIFFRRFEMKFVFAVFPYFRSFYFAVAWTLPMFFFISDFAVNTDESGVAHMAHIGGLLFGAAWAGIYQHIYPVKHPFMFEEEQSVYRKMIQAKAVPEMWPILEYGLSWNVQNRLFLERFFETAKQSGFRASPLQTKKLDGWMKYHLAKLNKSRDPEAISLFLAEANGAVSLDSFLSGLTWQNILTIADHSTKQRRWALSLVLYRHCWTLVSSNETRELLTATCDKIEQVIAEETQSPSRRLTAVGE